MEKLWDLKDVLVIKLIFTFFEHYGFVTWEYAIREIRKVVCFIIRMEKAAGTWQIGINVNKIFRL